MTKPELDAITTAVHTLEASFHVLQICPPAKRQRTPTIGRHREQFAAIALEAGRQFEALMPRDLDMQEVAAIRHERLHLQALRQKVRHLNALLDGHLHAVGHADYQNCTRIYRMLRAATHLEGHDLDSALDALGKAYSEKRAGEGDEAEPMEHEAPGAEAETQNQVPPQANTCTATCRGTGDLSRRSAAKTEAVSTEESQGSVWTSGPAGRKTQIGEPTHPSLNAHMPWPKAPQKYRRIPISGPI